MKTSYVVSSVALIVMSTAAPTSSAQDVPRMANGKPDFSGIYTPPSTVNATGPRGNLIFNADKMAPVKPGAEGLLYEARNGDPRHDEPRAMCLPAGFPSGMLYILPIQIVQNPNHIVIIPELQRDEVKHAGDLGMPLEERLHVGGHPRIGTLPNEHRLHFDGDEHRHHDQQQADRYGAERVPNRIARHDGEHDRKQRERQA